MGLGNQAGRAASPSGNITTADDIICLGNNDIATLYCTQSSISTSDGRDKTDVEDFTHGLNFINQMRPVTYRWDRRSWYVDKEEPDAKDIMDATPDGAMKKDKINI